MGILAKSSQNQLDLTQFHCFFTYQQPQIHEVIGPLTLNQLRKLHMISGHTDILLSGHPGPHRSLYVQYQGQTTTTTTTGSLGEWSFFNNRGRLVDWGGGGTKEKSDPSGGGPKNGF